MIWQVLDVRAIWIKEFAAALAAEAPTLGWCPQITGTGRFRDHETETILADPEISIRYFPLQRGFAKFPVNVIAREGERVLRRLLRRTERPADSVLVCCSPHYAPVAEKWPGRVVYYVTDLFVACGDNAALVNAFDRRLCQTADLICPNSERIAEYLIDEAGCEAEKVTVIPNATRKESILSAPSPGAVTEGPSDLQNLPRPIAGVLGNLAGNTDWLLIRDVVESTPWLSWMFVGPTDIAVLDSHQRNARDNLQQHGGRIRFVGPKPYSQLKEYARAIDVAVLPYRKSEPTYSGSSTRFYEHLAAGRPMVATRAIAELLKKEPLLRLVDSAEEMIGAFEQLRAVNFRDGFETLRWTASQTETWHARASKMAAALKIQAAVDREAA